MLAVAARDGDVDVLLGARDALLVALPATADPALARLALAGAGELVPRAAAVALGLRSRPAGAGARRACARRAPIRRAVAGLLP